MKNIVTLSVLMVAVCALSQENKHIVGVSLGSSLPWENGIYIDYDDYETWPDNKAHAVINLFYEYRLTKQFRIGGQVEHEKNNIEVTYPFEEKVEARRIAIGLHWLGHFPDNPLSLELGGYSNLAFCSSDDWDTNLKGVEYGIMVGPAYDLDVVKLALHFQPGFSYLFSDDIPEDVLLMYPRILFKLYYTL
jgi:hypothetical protein